MQCPAWGATPPPWALQGCWTLQTSTVDVCVSSVVLNRGLLHNWQWGLAPRRCLCCLYHSLLCLSRLLLCYLSMTWAVCSKVQRCCLSIHLTHCAVGQHDSQHRMGLMSSVHHTLSSAGGRNLLGGWLPWCGDLAVLCGVTCGHSVSLWLLMPADPLEVSCMRGVLEDWVD